MLARTLVDATDLKTWADRRDAQGLFPKLLRRLIYSTVEGIKRIDFSSDEAVQLGGWDGILEVETGNAFIPDGLSAWELGVNRDVKGKADGDYEKRRDNPLGLNPAETTFVFATLRRWGGKAYWVANRKAEGIWRDVRAYDADDLEAWLELAPGVHIWLSILLGKHPEGAVYITNFWQDWSEATIPPMSPELVIAGRTDETERIHSWLREPPSSLSLQAESREEALAFFAAAIYQLPPDEREVFLARAVVVKDPAAWHQLVASTPSLLLVPMFDAPEAVTRALRQGHQVLIPLGKETARSGATVPIPRLRRSEVKRAILALGFSEDRADDLATLARRSFMAFRRKIAINPEVQLPKWADPKEARSLLPAMLVGAWDDTSEGDRDVVAKLANKSYEEVNSVLVRWANESDPPVRRVGNTWLLASKEDTWTLLDRFLTRDDLDNFERVVLEVMGQADPRFDLPPDDQWKANLLGKSLPYSGLLREGLAETLALMGARSESIGFADAASGQERADRIVRRLLVKANEDWRVWASLSYILPLLAEATPNVFLDEVERGLSGDQPILLNLFSEGKDSFTSSSSHTGLLWALEVVSWNPSCLGHAALLLAKLTRMDPGGKLANRPGSSLREIFLCWHPQTMANLEKRLQVLDAIRTREPKVAWPLLYSLLPEAHSVAMPTAKPRWREWAPETQPQITYAELFEAEREIVSRLLTDVVVDGRRWCNLINKLDDVSREQHERIVNNLLAVCIEYFTPEDRILIWDALRTVISDHREFSDAEWAMPKEFVDRLQQVYERFGPSDPIAKQAHLFSKRPNLLEPPKHDWKARHDALEAARVEAVHEVASEGGLPLLIEMAARVEEPGMLGVALGGTDLFEDEEDALLNQHLGSPDNCQNLFSSGFVVGRFQKRGWDWASAKLLAATKMAWPAQRFASFFIRLPFERQTWELVEKMNEETQRLYWSQVAPFPLGDKADCERAAIALIENGRPHVAIDFIAVYSYGEQDLVSPNVVAQALEDTLQLPADKVDWGALGHDITQLIKLLEASGEVDESRVAGLEWAYLPIMRHYGEPQTLHRELSRNPNFFVDAIGLVYKGENEDRREFSEEDMARARYVHQLLESWHECPGRKEDGSLDGEALREWISQARRSLQESGRGRIGDYAIGEVLRYAPSGPDGVWPHVAVRDLIEELASEAIERGIETEVYNSRGVTSRGLTDGGAQERQLVERYTNYANRVSDAWPRTAAMLRRLANTYNSEARREDLNAELTEDLWR